MILIDVNVLVYASRSDVKEHGRYRDWLKGVVEAPEAFGVSDLVLSSFVRIVTNPRAFPVPTPLPDALEFAGQLRDQPNAVHVEPGERHWEIFSDLCARANARGNLVTDAWLAALAVESGSEWITEDADYARFPGLRWRRPFEDDRIGEGAVPYRTGKKLEREFLLSLVRENGRSLARAAKAAAMDRRVFSALLRKHGIHLAG